MFVSHACMFFSAGNITWHFPDIPAIRPQGLCASVPPPQANHRAGLLVIAIADASELNLNLVLASQRSKAWTPRFVSSAPMVGTQQPQHGVRGALTAPRANARVNS